MWVTMESIYLSFFSKQVYETKSRPNSKELTKHRSKKDKINEDYSTQIVQDKTVWKIKYQFYGVLWIIRQKMCIP